MFLLESPHQGDSNTYTQYTISNRKKETHPELSEICCYGIFFDELKNKFETTGVNEPSVFEPLKFYCTWVNLKLSFRLHCCIYMIRH